MRIRLSELRRVIREEARRLGEASKRGRALAARIARVLGSAGFNLDQHEIDDMALQGVFNIMADPADVMRVFKNELGPPTRRYDTGYVRWRVDDGAVSVGPGEDGSTIVMVD